MNAYEAYCLYLALRQHFTQPSYDFFKFNGRVRANVTSFKARPDVWRFKRIAEHHDPKGLILANLLVNEKCQPVDLLSDKGLNNYLEYKARVTSVTYLLSEELAEFKPHFRDNFELQKGGLPYAIELFLRNKISFETLTLIVYDSGVIDFYSKKLNENTLWDSLEFKMRRYRPFIPKVDTMTIVKQKIGERQDASM